MLLSSVSLVAKPKNGKPKDIVEKKTYRRTQNDTEVSCQLCQKEIEEDNFIFKFPSSTSDKQTCDLKLKSQGDRVTIATGDALCLSVDKFYYNIVLREETECDTTCIFRKKILETKSMPNGHVETVVFALDCDQDFFLTSNSHGDLELNYHSHIARADEPDERMFDVYFTNLGHVLIQPKLRANTYLHHIDQALSIQQLDLNWRCPEEYFFHFNAVPENPERKRSQRKKVCTHVLNIEDIPSELCPVAEQQKANVNDTNVNDTNVNDTNVNDTSVNDNDATHPEPIRQLTERFIIQLPTRTSAKSKKTLSTLFFGCFSARSQRISVS